MEAKLKINSCFIEGGDATVEISIFNLEKGSLLTIESSDPSPVFIIGLDGSRDIAYNFICTDEYINLKLAVKVSNDVRSIPVFATIKHQEETSMLADVYLLNTEDEADSSLLVFPSFVGSEDKVSISVSGEPGESVEFQIGSRSFHGIVNVKGKASIDLPSSSILSKDIFTKKTITKLEVSAVKPDGRRHVNYIHAVPRTMYALAAVDDVNRPNCVIMDPSSAAIFSLAADSYPQKCFSEPLIAYALNSRGEQTADLETYSDNWKDCDNAYSTQMAGVATSDCRIHENYKVVKLDRSVRVISDDQGAMDIDGEWAAVWSACDPNPNSATTVFDPCNISGDVLSKIPRIFLAVSNSAVAVDVIRTARLAIKKSPAYYHSAFLLNPQVGKIASIIIRIAGGEQISKTVNASADVRNTLSALRTELLADQNFINSGITININGNGSNSRLDFGSDEKFTIKAGSISTQSGENCLRVTLNSNYVVEGEITYPDEAIGDMASANYILMLDGPFRGLVFPCNASGLSISIDACPRVNTIGSFRVDQDYSCMHVALLRDLTRSTASPTIVKLPFIIGENGDVIPASSPSINSNGSIVCTGVDGSNTYIYHHNGLNESEPWTRITDKSFDFPLIATDGVVGDECIICETPVGEETQLHACYIGANTAPRVHSHISSLWNTLSSSDVWSQYVNIGNLDQYSAISSLSGATLINRDSVVNLSLGAYRAQQAIVVYESLRPADFASSDSFYNSLYETTPGSACPAYDHASFTKGQQIASILVHLDPSSASSFSINLGIRGKIAKIFAHGTDLSRTDYSLGMHVLRGDSSSGMGMYPYVGAGTSMMSLFVSVNGSSNSITINPMVNGTGLRRMRIIVVPDSNLSGTMDDWVRIASGDSLVSVPSSDSVVMEMTPDGSECAAVARIYKDEEGNYFDGKFDQINMGVDCYVNVSDIYGLSSEANLTNAALNSFIPSLSVTRKYSPSDIITNIINDSFSNNAWRYSVEYIGPALSSRSPINPNSPEYIRNGTSIFGSGSTSGTGPTMSGLQAGDLCAVVLFDVKSNNSLQSATGFQMFFNGPICHIDLKTSSGDEVAASDSEYASFTSSGLTAKRNAQLLCNSSVNELRIYLGTDRKSLAVNCNNNSASLTRYGMRVYIKIDQSEILGPKSENDIQKIINNIKLSTPVAGNNLYFYNLNKMRFAKSGLRFDSCIPLVSSCRFDDLNVNINAEIPNEHDQTGQLNLEASDDEYAAIPDSPSSAAPDVYEQVLPFRFGSRKSNLNSWGVALLLEKETCIFTNSETPSEYSSRTGSLNGYIESKTHEIFTGKGRLALVTNPRDSKALDGSIGYPSWTIAEGDDFLVQGGFRLSISSCTNKLPAEYIEMSKRRDKLVADPDDPSYETAKFSSLILCAINGVPHVAGNIIHDMPSKGRQFDICFGNPYGEHPHHDINTQMPIPFRSGRRYKLEFSSIYIGPPKVRFTDELRVSELDFSTNTMFVPSPVSNSYLQNRSFESSFTDPGDFILLEDGNGYIDNWDIVAGGVCYSGKYMSSFNGNRSIILESNVSSTYSQLPTSSVYANYTFTKNKRARYSSGVGGGIKTSVSLPSQVCILDASLGMRRYSSTDPSRFRSVMLSAGSNAGVYRISSRNGTFLQGDKPDYRRSRLEFSGTGSSMDMYVHALDTDIHKMMCFSNSNYYGDGSYSSSTYNNHISAFFYFINADGNLNKLFTDSVIMANWAGNPQKAQTNSQIATNVVKFASKGSATVDATDEDSYIVYLKRDGSLGQLLEHGTAPYTLPSGNDFVDVAAGLNFGLALRKDGTIEAWGDDTDGVVSGVPAGKFVSIDCGSHFACALSDDGTINCWGDNSVNQCNPPSGIFVKVRCGWDCGVAIDRDGYPSCWGKEPASGPWAEPSIKLRDAHLGGGPISRIYPSTISSNGGTSWPAGGDPLHNTEIIHTGEISRYAVGITVDGDIVTWGDDDTLLIDDTQKASSLDNLLLYKEFSAIPSANYVFVSCGPQGACAVTDDGQIFGFGSGQVPFQSDGSARHLSYFKNEFCVHKGGPIIDDVSVAPSHMIYEEDENPPRWAQMGFANESEWTVSRGITSGRTFSSCPITLHDQGINRTASIDEKKGRIHIAFESTRDSQNSICYSSSYPEISRFTHGFRLTEGAIEKNRPSIAVDFNDRKLIAWRERRGGQESISCATYSETNISDPDECFVDSCVLALRKYKSDDPYYIHSVQECSISENMSFSDSASNVYFNVQFFNDSDMKDDSRVAIYSSLDTPDNFTVAGEPITSAGISVLPMQNYNVVFNAPNDPAILGMPLWYKMTAISSGNEYGSSSVITDYLILKSTGTILDGINDCTTGCLDQEGEVYVVYEGVQRYNFDIVPQDVQSFNAAANVSSYDSGIFLPNNYNILPGVKSQIRTMTYVIHIANNAASYSSGKEYSAKIGFSSPIAAIVFDGDELDKTDGIAQSNAFYPSAARRGTVFAPGTKIVLSPDGSTVQINFVSKQASGADVATQQLRIFTIETAAIDSEKTGIFGCDKVRNSPCGVQFVFNNDIGETNNYFGNVHFRATVFSSIDSSVNDAIATFTSVTHPHMWSYGDEVFSSAGLFMYKNDSAGIGFYPDMLDPSSAMSSFDESDSFSRTLSNGSIYYDSVREALFFDIAYRVRIDAIFTMVPSLGGGVTYKNNIVERTLFCNKPENYYNDVSKWSCSRSGGSDIVISNSNIAGNPSVSAGRQTFYIAFEKYSDPDQDRSIPDCPDICLSVWDAEENRFDASGQGGKDRIVNLGYTIGDTAPVKYRLPQVIIDDMSNFSVFGINQRDNGSTLGKADGSVGYQRTPEIITDIEDLRPCSFSDSLGERFASGDAAPSYMKIRVHEEDVIAFKPNFPNSPYPIVSSPFINLDIIGVPGVYAVRLRNDDDAEFSPWIPIGGDVPVLPLSVSDSADYRDFQNLFRARFISRDRFVVPWMLSAGEGHKTVCVEALTFFGKTAEFCTQVICHPSMPNYKVDFYAKSEANYYPVSYYKDYPVISPFAFAADKPQISDQDLRSINEANRLDVSEIKFEVLFNDYGLIDKLVRLSSLSFFKKRLLGRSAITAQVIYRGIDLVDIDLEQDPVYKNKFNGLFYFKHADGIFRKDGLSLVKINIPLLGIRENYIDFFRQIQELKGQAVNNSYISYKPYSNSLMPPVDEDVIARAFGNSEYYS